jgi:hypothetical protein
LDGGHLNTGNDCHDDILSLLPSLTHSLNVSEKMSIASGIGSFDSPWAPRSLIDKYIQKTFAKVKKTVLFWGVVLGIINFAGSGFQQW